MDHAPLTQEQEQLIKDHLPFVRAIARKLRAELSGVEFDDLVGFGMQGLLTATRRYDRSHGAAFTTFAYYRVRGAMLDGIRNMGWLPRNEYARLRFEERASAYLENLAAREGVKREALASAPEAPDPAGPDIEKDISDLASALSGVAVIFITLLSKADEDTLLDDRPAAQEQLEQHQLLQRVHRVLRTLPAKERRLIELYYFADQTLEQAGASMGLSKSWTSRLHARAVVLLRDGLLKRGKVED